MTDFGIALPQLAVGGVFDPDELKHFVTTAEALGYHTAWALDQPLAPAPTLDPLAVLAHGASGSETIQLGVAVLLSGLRPPVQLAKALSTIDQLSRGRLVVGAGLGNDASIYPAFGLSPRGRARRFEEGIVLLKRLWTEEHVTFDGEFSRVRDVTSQPRPVQQPHPPLWVGAHEPPAVERAVRLADGWIGAGIASTARFLDQLAEVRRQLDAARRDPAGFSIAKRVYLALADDPKAAWPRVRAWFATFYGAPDLAEQVTVVGDAERCGEELARLVAAGVDHIALHPVIDQPAHLEPLAEIVARL